MRQILLTGKSNQSYWGWNPTNQSENRRGNRRDEFCPSMAAVCENHLYSGSKITFLLKMMPLNPRWAFVLLVLTASLCFADDDHEMEEFLKREYSLSKPYQGNATWHGGRRQMFPEKKKSNQLTNSWLTNVLCCRNVLVWFTGFLLNPNQYLFTE